MTRIASQDWPTGHISDTAVPTRGTERAPVAGPLYAEARGTAGHREIPRGTRSTIVLGGSRRRIRPTGPRHSADSDIGRPTRVIPGAGRGHRQVT